MDVSDKMEGSRGGNKFSLKTWHSSLVPHQVSSPISERQVPSPETSQVPCQVSSFDTQVLSKTTTRVSRQDGPDLESNLKSNPR